MPDPGLHGQVSSRLLLVEDDVDTRDLIARFLRDDGYDVQEAVDGQAALAAIELEPPAVLITDCNLPYMTGNELVEVLALDHRLRVIPTIVISARAQATLPANVIVFLAKPFTMERLRAAIRVCLVAREPAPA